MSASTWKLEKDLCRCCHAEGSFHSLSEPRVNLGLTEVYSDMLKTCFDIEVSPVAGLLCAMTYSICDACIKRLRDASDFKQQVLLSEQRFKDMYKDIIKAFSPQYGKVKEESAGTYQKEVKEEYMDDDNDDDFQVKYESDDDEPVINIKDSSNENLIQIKIEENKRPRSKSKKLKTNQTKKRVPKTKKTETEAEEEEGDGEGVEAAEETGEIGEATEEKKVTRGAKKHPKFALKESDYRQESANFICLHCEKKYDKFFSLRFHVKTKHYKIPRYQCPCCEKEFMTPAPFTMHKLEEHNIDDRFNCKACNSVFNTKVQLRKHINNFHMLGEKYKCEFCEYESFSFEGMYKHKFKHKTVKDHHCRFCRKSFLRKATLDLHERIHTGDRRKVCKVCGQAFVQKASLNYHMTKYHPEVNF